MQKYQKNKIVKGTVTGIESYGAFVSFDEYYSGLIHISEISNGFVKCITDFVQIGDVIYTEILEVDEDLCRLKLSIKNINYRKTNHYKRRKIKETSLGFKTLEYKLPIWIEQKLKRIENNKEEFSVSFKKSYYSAIP